MTIEEAVSRSKNNMFPDIIDSKSGLYEVAELNVVGIPTWDRKKTNKKRKAILKITTHRGISTTAIHFYGKIIVDGVYQATLGNIEKVTNISQEDIKKHPFLSYDYIFEIKKPITKYDIETNPTRYYAYKPGMLTNGFDDIEELINYAKEIFKLRFTGDWEFLILYPRGNKEIVNI